MIYLFPTDNEAAMFRAARPDAEVIICGVGVVECAATIASLPRDEEIILAGIAGSHNPEKAPIGAVVEVISEELYGLPERFARRYSRPGRYDLPRVSSATVSQSAASSAIYEIENMEGAALFALAEHRGGEVCELRAISNMVGDSFDRWQVERALRALTELLLKI